MILNQRVFYGGEASGTSQLTRLCSKQQSAVSACVTHYVTSAVRSHHGDRTPRLCCVLNELAGESIINIHTNMLLCQRRRKCRELTGPTPHAVAVVRHAKLRLMLMLMLLVLGFYWVSTAV